MTEQPRPRPAARAVWADVTKKLPPSAFAFVMATGIVSAALAAAGAAAASIAFLVCALAALVILVAVTLMRMLRHRPDVLADARDPRRGFGYLTIVAGFGVVAVRLGDLRVDAVAAVCLVIAATLWVVLAYALPATLILRPHATPVSADIDGSWFLWVVGTQSVAVALAAVDRAPDGLVVVLTAGLWGIGVVLYGILATLILLRLLTVPNSPDSFTPAYWIFTGATAISVLAGVRLLSLPDDAPLVRAISPFVSGAVFVLWAFGTWWIPLLVIFGMWRHVVHRQPFRYETGLWSIVFPLGTYATATLGLGRGLESPALVALGRGAVYIAAAAWAIAFVMMALAGGRYLAAPRIPEDERL